MLIGGAAAVAVAAAGVALTSPAHAATQICSPQTGTNGGNYYSFWNNGQGTSCITLNSGTSYTSSWSNIGDWDGGVGWNPGSTSRSISYSASLSGNGGAALMALYGWSTSPLVEYYVIDNWVGSPNLGSMHYQIMATETWGNGSGSSSVNIGGSAPPTTSGPGGDSGTCSASYSVSNSWPGGFNGAVTVTAGSSAITGGPCT